jgi:hypothetical protein
MRKAFIEKKNAPAEIPLERSRNRIAEKLADLGPEEPPMVFDADPSTAEQIGHRRNRFAATLCAGADGENKVAKGKLFWLAEDLRVLFHAYVL